MLIVAQVSQSFKRTSGESGRGRQMSKDVRTAQCSVVRPVRLLRRVAIDRQADQVPSGSEMAQKALRLFHT